MGLNEEELTYEELVGPEAEKDEDLEAKAKLQAHDLFARLQGTFSEPAYITLEEVRDATGFDSNRSADAMAISLYRSRGKALWGFEFKVSRSDWLHELKQPEKSESILQFCDYWALVVPNKDIVKTGELPSTWGLYVAQKNRLKCITPCPKLDPLPMTRTMLTALAYAIDQKHKRNTKSDLSKSWNDGYKKGLESTNHEWYEEQYNKINQKVEEFEKASGLQIRYGSAAPEKIGGIVSAILRGDAKLNRVLTDIRYSIKSAEDLKTTLESQAKEIEVFLEKKEPQ
jgi:hypothetical protein